VTVILITVKSFNSLLRMLAVSINIYPKSDLRYKFLILGTYYLDKLYLREHGCDGPWFLIQAKRSLRPTKFGKHSSKSF